MDGEETVGVLFLTDALEKDGQVVMVVELCDVDLPVDAVVGGAVDRSDWQISSVVETAEVSRRHRLRS